MTHEMNRRVFIGMSAAAGAIAVAGRPILAQSAPPAARPASQQGDPGSVPIHTTQIAGNLYLLQGAGGNMVLQTGEDGSLLIDSSFAPAVPRIQAAIAAIAPRSSGGLLVNTHWHGDHTGGNAGLHTAGFTIVAHRATRERLSTEQTMKLFHRTIPPAPAEALPSIGIDQSLTIWHNGDTIELTHVSPAHTDTDLAIYYRNADVLHTGDLWFNYSYPFIDEGSGGSIGGMINAGEQILKIASASTKIVPGHGPLGDKAGYQKFHQMLVAIRDKVAALKAAGLSEEDAVAKKPTAEFDAVFGGRFMTPEIFAGIVYRTV